MLQSALTARLKTPVSVLSIPGTERYIVVVPNKSQPLRFEFSRTRIGSSPMLAMLGDDKQDDIAQIGFGLLAIGGGAVGQHGQQDRKSVV